MKLWFCKLHKKKLKQSAQHKTAYTLGWTKVHIFSFLSSTYKLLIVMICLLALSSSIDRQLWLITTSTVKPKKYIFEMTRNLLQVARKIVFFALTRDLLEFFLKYGIELYFRFVAANYNLTLDFPYIFTFSFCVSLK